MILTDGTSLTTENVSPHKFGGDVMAEYLHYITLHGGQDDSSGDVESPMGWFARIGRRLLFEDDQGFVGQRRFSSEQAAIAMFNAMADHYCSWGDEDLSDDERVHLMDEADARIIAIDDRERRR